MAVPEGRARIDGFVFLAAAALGAAFSTMHLGRKRRAYRAVLNWRRSWLSREIILFSFFASVSAFHLLFDRDGAATGWIAAAAGVATLFAMDRVYGVTRTPGLWRHSAQVVLTGALVAAMVAGSGLLVAMAGSVKLVLYAGRRVAAGRKIAAGRKVVRLSLGAARVVVGLLVPVGMLLWGGRELIVVAAVLVAVGEVIDRCEFYLELDVPTPSKQMAADFAAAVRGATRDAA